jgi:erythromycin esterase
MKKSLALSLIILFASCQKEPEVTPSTTTTNTTTVVNERTSLNAILTPLKKSPLELENADLKIFDDLKSVPIVGLGEATHGTKEFFEMKHRLFKYFVENFNHRIFAFEMDYAESLIFDDYVQTGNGDLEQLMKTKMYFWTWNTVEVKNLLEWMKNYNQGKAEADRIHIYGIDCQTFIYNVPELIKRVSKIDASISDKLSNLIAVLPTLDRNYTGSLHDYVVQAQKLILDNKNSIIAKSSQKEYDIIEHLIQIILQTDMYNASSKNTITRDKYMADNVMWLSEKYAYPLSVWAHNGHIANDGTMMGAILAQKYQEKYRTVGFSFATGSATAVNLSTNKLSYNIFPESVSMDFANQLFSQTNTPNFVVKTAEVFSNDLLKSYFSKRTFYQIGSVFSNTLDATNFTTLKAYNFNYLIHINNSTHSDCYNVTQ